MTRADTAAKLRSDIDSGRTGDKVRAPDPAAAPLGADEEAAGTPLSRAVIAQARQTEGEWPPVAQERTAGRATGSDAGGLGATWILVAAAVVIAVILLGAILGRG
jgi:hypothetical protein